MSGFDFLGYAIAERRGYALLLVLFLIFQSMILLNGLIGIFGDAFVAEASSTEDQNQQNRVLETANKGLKSAARPNELYLVLHTARTKMKRASSSVYWGMVLLTTLLALVEPFIICLRERLVHSLWLTLQFVALIASTVSYVFLMFSTYRFLDKEKAGANLWERLMCLFDFEVKVDTTCLVLGWVFLLRSPGIASLRCLRVFRVLWFFEVVKIETLKNPGDHMLDFAKCFHLCVQVCSESRILTPRFSLPEKY